MNDDIRGLAELDRLIHEPARLIITTILYSVERADFLYLMRETGLTRGNLSSHLSKLEEAGYIEIKKTYRGKLPLTICHLTKSGREAFDGYRQQIQTYIDNIR
jgi:DNA-binding MarR family transcriptional regulator